MGNHYTILTILLLPVLGGVVAFYLGKKNKQTRNDWLDLVMIVELAMQVALGYQLIRYGREAELNLSGILGIDMTFRADGVRLLLCIMVTVVFGLVLQFMKESMKQEESSNRFYLLFMGVYSMVSGAFLTGNLLDFVIFISLASLLLYPMILHRRDEVVQKNAGIYLSYLISAIAVLQIGLVIVYFYIKNLGYVEMHFAIRLNGSTVPTVLGSLLLFLGFAVFAGVFPVQLMITRGSSYSLMEASVILSSVISKLGVYGILLLVSDLLLQNIVFGRILLLAGLLTAVWGVMISLSATDIRKILMGITVATNGFHLLSVSGIELSLGSSGYAVRSSYYMMITSTLSLIVLYMTSLELVRKKNTFEIKGLIASGKGTPLLAIACFIACASLCGVPGTAGFLAYSALFKTIQANPGWKWLICFYIIIWAFLMTAVVRVFMKFFVSKKDEALRIMSSEEELAVQEELVEERKKNPYRLWLSFFIR